VRNKIVWYQKTPRPESRHPGSWEKIQRYRGIIQDTERYRKKKYDATLMHSSDTIGGVYTQDKMQGTQTASKSSFIFSC